MLLFFGAGFAVLTLMGVMLFSSAVISAVVGSGLFVIAALLIMMTIGLVYKSGLEFKMSLLPAIEQGMKIERNDMYNFISVFLGALITFYISIELGLGAVVASGLVGIFATALFPKHDAAIFCGSFVGMASNQLLTSYYQVALAGLVASAVFVAGKYCFNGFGGKLGTTAFTGCVVAALLSGQSFVAGTVPDWQLTQLLLVYSILGAVITYIISIRFDNSAVISSGVVGVTAGLILPVIYPEVGVTLAVMAFCASFAGMSSPERMPNELWMVVAGVFAALIFAYSAPYFGGAGGKLGTTAFGSVVCMRGLAYGIEQVKGLVSGGERVESNSQVLSTEK